MFTTRSLASFLLPLLQPLLAGLCMPQTAAAQCTPGWLPGEGVPGVGEGFATPVLATTMWDPDGAGPQGPKLVVGGNFRDAANIPHVNNIAAFDPVTGAWSALGSGLSASVNALAVLPNGDLVAAGAFTTAGGVAVNCIARWNGSAWSAFGSGMNGPVYALAVLQDGDLVAAGAFTTAGGVAANRIARWRTSWSPLDLGLNGTVRALAVLPGGDLVAGGDFTTAGGLPENRIARFYVAFNAWGTSMGSGMNGTVYALKVLPFGQLVAGGAFTTAGGVLVNRIASWNGSAWSAYGSGMDGTVRALTVLPSGQLVAAGDFTSAGGVAAYRIARWGIGYSWYALDGGVYAPPNTYPLDWVSVRALAVLPNGDLVAGGAFKFAGQAALISADSIASWNWSGWSALSSGMNGTIRSFAVLPSGDLVAGGFFTSAGSVAANHVARWNGSAWSALGSGLNGEVLALAVLSNGDLVAGGSFSDFVARWTGNAWQTMGHPNGQVNAIAVLPNGNIVAGGHFTAADGNTTNRIARWNGSAWAAMGSGMSGGTYNGAFNETVVNAIAVLPNGNIVAGGNFTTAGGVAVNHIARWNGSAWAAMGSGVNLPVVQQYTDPVYALAVLQNGDLVAGGAFTAAGGVFTQGIATWNGSAWSGLAGGVGGRVSALAVLSNGDLVAGGYFLSAGGVSLGAESDIATWNGSAWSALVGGLDGAGLPAALAALPNNQLAVGGDFGTAGSHRSAYFARYATCIPYGPIVYCTAGTTSGGCVPAISGVGTPSIAANSGFNISVASVPSQKQGLFFYGTNGRKDTPWASGSTSYLCVKSPTSRTSQQSSGGTSGCDGTLSIDWLSFVASHPTLLGNPTTAGQAVSAQAWYRDPAAVKSTSLSAGLEFMMLP